MKNEIGLQSIKDLLGMNFYIPSYQRGYRWTKQQVEDLLNDIQEFIEKKQNGFYCIQPLVVKVKDANNNQWEVIDGQQRLTTIYILLSYFGFESAEKYSLEYDTREDSKLFLLNVDDNKKEDNIDYYHMIIAKQTIEKWFGDKGQNEKDKFKETLLNRVDFIWYESTDEDPIKVFTRLNIGKIALTNAELIKAMFLNKSNFQAGGDYQKIRLQQQEIAVEWDKIEYTLQNDEFWLFLNKPEYDKPTRIDFIFDLMCKKNVLGLDKEQLGNDDNDEYKTFRYFYFWFKKNSSNKMLECWKEVKTLFQTFQEWYNDLELYHYIGFLIEQGGSISEMIAKWRKNQTKDKFIEEYIISEIKKKLSNCSDLCKQYEVSGSPKTQCRPILLLHNIQTIINQNIELTKEKYKLPVFYKFPFHLFKKESWDVEHIDSHSKNELSDEKTQKEWLLQSYLGVGSDIQKEIKNFFKSTDDKMEFPALEKETEQNVERLQDDETKREKDMLWNFCLLDQSTNRGYGNAIFSAKRRVINGKLQGKKFDIKWNDKEMDISVIETNDTIAFIPPCTEKVFQKAYNPLPNGLREWDENDAEAYLKNIEITLGKFLNKGETNNDSN